MITVKRAAQSRKLGAFDHGKGAERKPTVHALKLNTSGPSLLQENGSLSFRQYFRCRDQTPRPLPAQPTRRHVAPPPSAFVPLCCLDLATTGGRVPLGGAAMPPPPIAASFPSWSPRPPACLPSIPTYQGGATHPKRAWVDCRGGERRRRDGEGRGAARGGGRRGGAAVADRHRAHHGRTVPSPAIALATLPRRLGILCPRRPTVAAAAVAANPTAAALCATMSPSPPPTRAFRSTAAGVSPTRLAAAVAVAATARACHCPRRPCRPPDASASARGGWVSPPRVRARLRRRPARVIRRRA